MGLKLSRAFAIIGCILFLSAKLFAQNCVLTGINNTTISSSCNQACRDLTFQIPDIRSTSTYTVVNIPYTPYPYVTADGIEDFNLYNDDRYSNVFSLPFPFCFYDSVYRKALISSNGLVTFDTTYTNCFGAAWAIDSTIPFASPFSCSVEDYPRASIMAAFMDIDPRPGPFSTITSSPPDRKIQWKVEGTAPCRRFVVSYFHIGAFQTTTCGQNPDSAATFQIVMYESTGLIDIFLQNKRCQAISFNGDRAILGVQDFSRTKAVAAPGKNATAWTASNEGYRFVPSGGVSRFVSSELLTMNLTHVAFANSSTSTPGLLDITFPNICSPNPSTQYIVRTIFSACDNPAVQLTSMDTITINLSGNLNPTVTSTNTACGPPSGTITVNLPAGATPPFNYVLDGGTPFVSSAFTHIFSNVAQGPHTVVVTGGNNTCTGSVSITVNQTNTLNATVSSTATTCTSSDGTITVTPVSGSAPYTFSLDGGLPQAGAAPHTFINVAPGPHNIKVTDAFSCSINIPVTVTVNPVLTTTVNKTDVLCNGGSTGSITVTQPTTGTAPYQYSLDGINWQTANTFNGLVAGAYTVHYRESNGCQGSQSVTITQPTQLTASSTAPPIATVGGTTTVTVTATGGTAPYTGTGTFIKNAGVYTFTVTDAHGCTATTTITLTDPGCNLILSTVVTNVGCNGANNGAFNLTVTGATGAVTYSWSNAATTEDISGLTAGTYTVTVTDGSGCTATATATITQPTQLTASSTAPPIATVGGTTTVTVTATGGTAPYTGTGTFTKNAGVYTFTVTDAHGCTATTSITLTDPGCNLNLSTVVTNVGCNGANNGAVNLTVTGATGAVTYSWSNAATTEDISGLTAGTYTVTVTDGSGCTATATATITQPTQLTASSTAPPIATVGGTTTVTVTATGGTAPYTGTGTFIKNAGVYTFTVTDAHGCTATTTITLTDPGCNLNLSTVVTNVGCNGANNGAVNLTVTGATGALTYSWSNAATTEDISGLTAGTYTVTVTDGSGCTATATTTITQPTQLTASSTASPIATVGGTTTVTVTAAGGTAPYTGTGTFAKNAGVYTFTVTDAHGCTATTSITLTDPGCNLSLFTVVTNVGCNGANNGAVNLTVTGATGAVTYSWSNAATTEDISGLTAGTYTVTVTDGSGCTATATATITQPTQLTASSTAPPIATVGGTTTVTVTATGGTAPYTGTGTFTKNAGVYTFTVTDAHGCTATTTITLNDPGCNLNLSTVVTNVSCNGGSSGAIDLTVTGATGALTYSWSNAATTEDISGLTAGTYTVTVTDASGCTATATATITQPTQLTASSTAPPIATVGGTTTVTVTATGGTAPYTGTGTFIKNAGVYTFTVTDAHGCTATASITLTNPGCNLNLATVVTDVNCNGGGSGAIDLTVTGATGALTYSWSNGATTEDISGLTAGTYTVTVTDASGCTATATATVGLNNILTFSKGNDTTICEGGSAQLVVTSNATTYTWTPATTLNNSRIANPVANPTITTQYTVTATLGGCTTSGTIKVTVNPAPVPNAGPDADICFGQDAQLSASGGTSYQWIPSTYLSSTTIPNPTVVQPQQNTQYILQVKDANGCTSLVTDNVFVRIAPPIIVTVSPKDSVVAEGEQIQLNATSIGTSYNWSNPSTLSNPDIPNPVASIPPGSIGNIYTYNVTASTSAGCKGVASVTLKVYKGPDIYLPTGFTPNGDGKNDRFHPITVGVKNINYFRVFNRWGQMVFSSTTLNEGWDGKLRGVEQPGGVYVWIVQAVTSDGRVINKKGTVTLIR